MTIIHIIVLSLVFEVFVGIDPDIVNKELDNNFVVFSEYKPYIRERREAQENKFIPNCITVTNWKWILNSTAIRNIDSRILLGSITHNGTLYKQYVKEVSCSGYNSTECLGIDTVNWSSYCEQTAVNINVSTYKDNDKGLLALNFHSGCRCMVKEKYMSNKANNIKKT
ncbi:SWPV1-253 [Shearwaterpox virus]|uniref:SWPV1-253 n=1 Tax=Shearwaterpox virus TaxID=1974596 RepID=A0A1V0S860_CNPV|nr:SWPV1-253 [Shearwaterpox virus]